MERISILCWVLAWLGHIWFWIEKGEQRPAVAPLLATGTIIIVLYAGAICRMLFPAPVFIPICMRRAMRRVTQNSGRTIVVSNRQETRVLSLAELSFVEASNHDLV